MKRIYLNNAATTAVDPEVLAALKPFFSKKYGNPSEFHILGREAKIAIENARNKIALFLGAKPEEIIFTGSATESINLSHKGLIEGLLENFRGKKRPHIITSSIEHKAVLETCKHLERKGEVSVTYLPVDNFGRVDVNKIKEEIKPETVLVSIMYVNNEVGTIEPIQKIGSIIKKINNSVRNNRIYFHTDATQALQYLNCKVDLLGIDFLSFTGHKIYAPKGIGTLFVRKGTPIIRQLDGGDQESGLRASTENVPFIVGLGKAIEIIKRLKTFNSEKIVRSRDRLIKGILTIPGVRLTGHPTERVPHIASFVVDGVEGESMVLFLSDLDIIASSGSACTSANLTSSHVLTAMGIPPEISHGSLRFSLGKNTKEQEIDYVIRKLPKVVNKLRRMAPKF